MTATAPYLLLTILLIRGVTLDGAADGLRLYVMPKFELLARGQVTGFFFCVCYVMCISSLSLHLSRTCDGRTCKQLVMV